MSATRCVRLALTGVVLAATLVACSGSSEPTVAGFVASLPRTATDNAAGPFVVDHVPAGHVLDDVVRGNSVGPEISPWCAGKVCASRAFRDWRDGLGVSQGATSWPKGSYGAVFDPPAPRVDDGRRYLLPTGAAIDVAMLPGSRADLRLGAAYDAWGYSDNGEEGRAHDVWFEARLVRVGTQRAVLTESYGSAENFPGDVKTLYFEGPHGELGVVRAASNIFFGSDIWPRAVGKAARLRASQREAARQQTSDAELTAVAASVHAATEADFTAAASRVAGNRVCVLDAADVNTRDERGIASGTLSGDTFTQRGQAWRLLQGHDASGHATCPRDDTTCPHELGPCLAWQPMWGDWQQSPAHAVYLEFEAQRGPDLFALSPGVRSLRIWTLTRGGSSRVAATVATAAGVNGVRWAVSPVPAYRVAALDATGRPLETVRTDLAGP